MPSNPFNQQWIMHAVHSWLKWASLDQVIELWWRSQSERATEEEIHQARLNDPEDMYGKDWDVVRTYYAKRKEGGAK